MKILIVSSYLPYPLINGGNIRLYNLIKSLSKKHKITLVCEKRGFQTEEDIIEVEKICEEVVTVDRKNQWTWKNIVQSGFSMRSFLEVGHDLPDMKAKIVDIMLKKTYDLIHVETFYVLQNVPKTYLPVVLVEHNIEYMVYKRNADNAKKYLQPLYYLDALKVKYGEEKSWKKADALVAVSQEEADKMKRANVYVVPNGVDLKKFTASTIKSTNRKKEKRILFIGDFKWLQNRDAVEWILREIWPKIALSVKDKEKELTIKFWVVGKIIPDSLRALGSEHVIFDENAPRETEKIYQQSTLLLAPIRVGGGTQYKILEAMASGVPVVTTSLGAEGIACDRHKDLLVADSAQEIAERTVAILQDEKQYEIIAKRARECIEKKYNWELISEKLDSVYKSMVQ